MPKLNPKGNERNPAFDGEYRFALDLAYAFKRPDKDRLLQELSAFEMMEWAAYFEVRDAELAAERDKQH